MREIPHSFEVTEIASEFIAPMTPANYFSTKTTKSVSVIVTGMTGTGRSVFGVGLLGSCICTIARVVRNYELKKK